MPHATVFGSAGIAGVSRTWNEQASGGLKTLGHRARQFSWGVRPLFLRNHRMIEDVFHAGVPGTRYYCSSLSNSLRITDASEALVLVFVVAKYCQLHQLRYDFQHYLYATIPASIKLRLTGKTQTLAC